MLSRRLLWSILVLVLAAGAWILKVEITYERNVRHIPADFHLRYHSAVRIWKT